MDEDKTPQREPWRPDWWFWIITAIIVMAMIAASQDSSQDGSGTPDIKGLDTMAGIVRVV